jgi:hypothetical protein
MGSISAQALALLIILSPGFLFLVGFNTAPAQYPSKQDGQRGNLTDAALFAVTSAGLHMTAGVVLLLAIDQFTRCSIIETVGELSGLQQPPGTSRCSTRTILIVGVLYSLALSSAAFFAGRTVGRLAASRPWVIEALHGRHYEVFANKQGLVIANVMTNVVHEARVLMYEGQLVELSVNGSRGINYVVLAGASRFYMTVTAKGSSTTPRHLFKPIDANAERESRLTIPGDKVVNLVTRTHPIVLTGATVDAAPMDRHRPMRHSRRWYLTSARAYPRWLRRHARIGVRPSDPRRLKS